MSDSTRISLELRQESWDQIFHVLKWCAPMELSIQEEAYTAQVGGHFSLGPFWAIVQELQRQLDERLALSDLASTIAKDGPQKRPPELQAESCGLCGKSFLKDTLIDIWIDGPADTDEQLKQRRGKDFVAQVTLVHHDCKKARTEAERPGGTKFTRKEGTP